MLIDLADTVGTYLHDVFVAQLDAWVIIGYVAQALFTMRFLVQWLASEKAGKSVVPLAFWIFSLGGGALLLVYALYKRDPVFIIGQSTGLLIYIRNLQLIQKSTQREKAEASLQAKG